MANFRGIPLGCAVGVGISSNEVNFISLTPHTFWRALIGFIAASLEVGQETQKFGEDTFDWYQLARKGGTDQPLAADRPQAASG